VAILITFPGSSPRHGCDLANQRQRQFINEAVSLPIEERALVMESLLCSLNQTDSKIDKKRAEESKQRRSELRSGQVEAIPGDKIFRRVGNRFEQYPKKRKCNKAEQGSHLAIEAVVADGLVPGVGHPQAAEGWGSG
jgi:hypothetical protein